MPRTDIRGGLLATAVLVVAACQGRDTPLSPPSSLALPGGGLPGSPGTVTDLAVDEVTQNSVTLSFTEVDDGLGQPARYVVRFAEPPIDWSSAANVTEGTCSTPVFGQEVGARLTCTVLGLAPSTTYQFQVAAYRSTLDLLETFGDPSNVVQGTTQGTTSCDCWTVATPMSTPRVGLGVAAINGVLYAVGGNGNDGAIFSTLEAYDPASDTWSTKAAMPAARTGVGVAALDGLLYVVGGSAGTLEAYDPATDTWTAKASMPTARHAPGVAAINGILYVVGGEAGAAADHAPLATVEAYDPATDTWTPKASMPTARSRLGVAVIGGILYAVGGYTGGASAVVEAYDPSSDAWTTKTRMSLPRYGVGVEAIDGTLYAVGGWMNGTHGTTEAYDPVSDAWTSKAEMPTPRVGLGIAAISGIVYAVGGSNEFGGPVATVEAYRP
jgi:N-acetylneuraminic acid mutarotase